MAETDADVVQVLDSLAGNMTMEKENIKEKFGTFEDGYSSDNF